MAGTSLDRRSLCPLGFSRTLPLELSALSTSRKLRHYKLLANVVIIVGNYKQERECSYSMYKLNIARASTDPILYTIYYSRVHLYLIW